jgi:hypothetical protein
VRATELSQDSLLLRDGIGNIENPFSENELTYFGGERIYSFRTLSEFQHHENHECESIVSSPSLARQLWKFLYPYAGRSLVDRKPREMERFSACYFA